MPSLLGEITRLVGYVLVIGEKEAGKTTLLNALAGRAHITPTPTKLATYIIRGVQLIEIGSHYKDQWENALKKRPNVVLYVMDLWRLEEDLNAYQTLELDEIPHVIIGNKIDLFDETEDSDTLIDAHLKKIRTEAKKSCLEIITCSALYNRGLRNILKILAKFRLESEELQKFQELKEDVQKRDEEIIDEALKKFKHLITRNKEKDLH